MNWLAEILVLLFSLSGLLFGLALAYIAPEELKAGKKYFLWLKRIILIALAAAAVYFSAILLSRIVFGLVFLMVLFADFKFNSHLKEIFIYPSFIASYFFIAGAEGKLLIASLIFLYGLPAGTLLKK